MMRFRSAAPARELGFDMTPMIDVVFLLIIFFLFTSQFARAVRTPVDLPDQAGDTDGATALGDLAIDVREDGRVFLDGREVSVEQFLAMVAVHVDRAGGPDAVQVLVRADHRGSARVINELATRLAAMGVRQWKLATAAPREQR